MLKTALSQLNRMCGVVEEAEMLLLLSRIFEYQIRGSNIVTIDRERKAMQNYIDFFSVRYQYSFDYSVDFEDRILNCVIPRQTFQPVLENYFVHGYRGDGLDCIRIWGYLDEADDMIHVVFRNNGHGLSKEKVESIKKMLDMENTDSDHIGLRNVKNRLKIAFGKESSVELSADESEPGVCVTLIFGRTLVMKDLL